MSHYGSYFTSEISMLYLHAHNSVTISVLLNSASRKYPMGSVAKLLNVSKMCRSAKLFCLFVFFLNLGSKSIFVVVSRVHSVENTGRQYGRR